MDAAVYMKVMHSAPCFFGGILSFLVMTSSFNRWGKPEQADEESKEEEEDE